MMTTKLGPFKEISKSQAAHRLGGEYYDVEILEAYEASLPIGDAKTAQIAQKILNVPPVKSELEGVFFNGVMFYLLLASLSRGIPDNLAYLIKDLLGTYHLFVVKIRAEDPNKVICYLHSLLWSRRTGGFYEIAGMSGEVDSCETNELIRAILSGGDISDLSSLLPEWWTELY